MPAVSHRGRGRRTINEINMVPFIDVMLVLLIIFMVTAPLIAPSMIELPSMGKGKNTPDRVIQIIIGKDEALTLRQDDQNTPVTIKDLVRSVKAAQLAPVGQTASANTSNSTAPKKPGAGPAPANTAVVISADKNVKYEAVVKVMDALQRAGIPRVGLAVQVVN
jgi:biopolymer transport protein TolR